MNTKNWKIDLDKTQIHSVSNVFVKWLDDISFQTWFEVEENQDWWTNQQIKSFENFLTKSSTLKKELIEQLNSVYLKEFEIGRIEKVQFENILDSINWTSSHICIPQLYDSENEYVFILPETNWKIVDSNCTLELEILFSDGEIVLCQEMSGLWNRIEWFENYIKRENNFQKEL